MSKDRKEKRAKQARVRRAHLKKCLLQEQTNGDRATTKSKEQFSHALAKRTSVLNYDKQRVAKRRKKLSGAIAKEISAALEKAEKIKKTKHMYYLKSKAKGKFRI